MGWRLHLTNQAIHRLHILPGKKLLLAVWLQRNRLFYFDLESGAQIGERTLRDVQAESRQDARWTEYVAGLVAPNKAMLPFVTTSQGDLYLSNDGSFQLYHPGGAELVLARGDKEYTLKGGDAARFTVIALDRYLGLIGALDERGCLHLYQQENPVGVFDLRLQPHPENAPGLAITQGGGAIYATDGQQLVLVDADGQVKKRLMTHYTIGRLACSPNGRLVVTCDVETNVLRGYDGNSLSARYQRHAVDLMAQATQLQLIADLPPAQVAVSALALSNKGTVAFALAGVICTSEVTEMDALPG